MMRFKVNYYNNLLVGVSNETVNGFPLAFIKALTGKAKANEKSEEEIKHWLYRKSRYQGSQEDWLKSLGESPVKIYSNKSMFDFKVVGFSNRTSTSNKHIRILHPEGFVFETPIEGFNNLIPHVTIEHGVVKDPCALAFSYGNIYLLALGTEMWDGIFKADAYPLKAKDLEVGEKIVYYEKSHTKIVDKKEMIYAGVRSVRARSGKNPHTLETYSGHAFIMGESKTLVLNKEIPIKVTENCIVDKVDVNLEDMVFEKIVGTSVLGANYYSYLELVEIL